FILTEKLEIKRLAFLDLLKEAAEKSAEHADEQFDADFALMTGELSRFLPQLVSALGGEVAEEK
ncbi:MAG: recombination-associated protein RdgC, partial [Azonexus sp.]